MALEEGRQHAEAPLADANLPIPPELMEAAQRAFPSRMQDPDDEGQKVRELTTFAASEGRGGDPAALLNFFHFLESRSTLGGNRSSLDRAWHAMKQLQVQRAIQDMARG